MPEWERHRLTLTLLEGRRAATDGFMWQGGPVLALAVQAFLLRILADPSARLGVAIVVGVGGALATSAATLALFILHDRERAFSERIREHTDALRMEDLARRASGRDPDHPLELKGRIVWATVLGPFVAIDAVVLSATQNCVLAAIPVLVAPFIAYGFAGAWCDLSAKRQGQSSS